MNNEKQKTAIDFAFEKLANQGLLIYKEYTNLVAYQEAKEMEKQKMIDFAFNALKIADNTMNGYVDVDKLYEQTYGGNK